jgi:hypothetical protein
MQFKESRLIVFQLYLLVSIFTSFDPFLSLPLSSPQDRLLKEGVEKHAGHGVGMWKKVAEYVSAGIGE